MGKSYSKLQRTLDSLPIKGFYVYGKENSWKNAC